MSCLLCKSSLLTPSAFQYTRFISHYIYYLTLSYWSTGNTKYLYFFLCVLQAFAVLSPALQPMLDRVKSNRAHWIELSDNDKNGGDKIEYNLDKEIPEKNDKSSISSQNVDDTENTYEGDSSGAVSLSSETNSKYENLENPVVGLLCNNVLALRDPTKFCHLNDY